MKCNENERIKPIKNNREKSYNSTEIPLIAQQNIFNQLNNNPQNIITNESENQILYNYKEINLENTLNEKDKKKYLYFKELNIFSNFMNYKCCKRFPKGINAIQMINIVLSIIILCLSIASLSIITINNKYYILFSLKYITIISDF